MALTATNYLPPTTFPSSSLATAAAVPGLAPSSPSPNSSPSHDFTFTIPLDPPPPPLPSSSSSSPLPSPRSTAASRPQAAAGGGTGVKAGGGGTIDLAPADDIFFHGHLLPLLILTRPPLSPRRSTDQHRQLRPAVSSSNTPTIAAAAVQRNGSTSSTATDRSFDDARGGKDAKAKGSKAAKGKSKSKNFALSLFAGFWRKDANNLNGKSQNWEGEGDRDDDDALAAAKRKRRHYLDDVGRALRKYAAAALEVLLSPRGANSSADQRRRAGQRDLRRQAHSFSSGYLSSKKGSERGERPAGSSASLSFKRRKGHWGELASAPASMRTSPNNSGLLVAGPINKTSAESTMEELQNAIQAAIAHCKSSIAVKDKDKDDSTNDTAVTTTAIAAATVNTRATVHEKDE